MRQVVKRYRRKRVWACITGWSSAPGCGQTGAGHHGWHINTAFIERANLSIRQHVAAVGRRVTTLCKHEAGLRQQLALMACTIISASPCQHTPTTAAARASPTAMALGKRWQPQTTSDGSWTHGSHLDAARGAIVHVPPRRSHRRCEQRVNWRL